MTLIVCLTNQVFRARKDYSRVLVISNELDYWSLNTIDTIPTMLLITATVITTRSCVSSQSLLLV
jgi:hypothetical protein